MKRFKKVSDRFKKETKNKSKEEKRSVLFPVVVVWAFSLVFIVCLHSEFAALSLDGEHLDLEEQSAAGRNAPRRKAIRAVPRARDPTKTKTKSKSNQYKNEYFPLAIHIHIHSSSWSECSR